MITSEAIAQIMTYQQKLKNNLDDFKTNDTKTTIRTYKTATDEELITINSIINETGIDKNKLAYNVRVLQLQPKAIWNKTHLYSKEDVITLLTYMLYGYQLDQLKSQMQQL